MMIFGFILGDSILLHLNFTIINRRLNKVDKALLVVKKVLKEGVLHVIPSIA